MRGTKVFGLSVALIFSIFSLVAGALIASGYSGQTMRVSVSSAGVPAQGLVPSDIVSASGVLSGDGRYVVFWSTVSNLVPGVSGGQVYRHDRTTHVTELVSAATTSPTTGGNNVSRDPSISRYGNFVVFSSFATDLVATDTNGAVMDVFVRDMNTGVTTLVSTNTAGAQGDIGSSLSGLSGAHEISDDGRYVVFMSFATNFADTNNGLKQVYVKDTTSGATPPTPGALWRASVNDAGDAGDRASQSPSISGDGLTVAFNSAATNFSDRSRSGILQQVFVRRLPAGPTTLESGGAADTGRSATTPVLSSSGQYLAFESTAVLDPADLDNGTPDVYRRDRVADTTVLASLSPNAVGGANSGSPSISGDGRWVAYNSIDEKVFGDPSKDTNGIIADVFIYDSVSRSVSFASLNDAGEQATLASGGASLSFDGHAVLFASTAPNVVAVPLSTGNQLYVRNLVSNQAPVIPALGSDVALLEAQPLRLTWHFSDPDSTLWNGRVNWGDGSSTPSLELNADKTFLLDHLYAPGAYDLRVEVRDDAGAIGSLMIHVVVTNVVPLVNMSSTTYLAITKTLDTSGTFTDPGSNETYSATVDYGDGTGTQALALGPYSAPPPVAGSFTLHHTYVAAGTFNVAVTVSDGRGLPSSATMSVKVNGAPVIPAFGKDITRFENEPLHLLWEFTDNDSTAWTATVDYGDGSGARPLTLNANKTFSLDHLWAPGAYNMTVAVTDDAGTGLTGSGVFHVVVSNDPPMTGLPATLDLSFSRTLDYTGAFTDRGSNETYSATVNYGDGTGTQPLSLGPYDASPLVGGSFTLHHTYAASGTYNVSLTVSDSNGGSTTVGMTVKAGLYSYEWLDPLGDFVVGRNLPVKFTVRGPDGSFVLDQSVQVDVIDPANNVKAGPYVFGDQPSRSVTVSNDSYHVNVDTRDLAPGMYWLRVQFSSPTLAGEFRIGTTGTASGTTTPRSRAVR